MSRPTKDEAGMGLPPLREYWRELNRLEREARAQQRATSKAFDKRRPKCRCTAYPWPHRPGGGFCRFPDPPVECWQRKTQSRPYGTRYTGLLRQIARANGLHPIRDRAAIQAMLPIVRGLAKQLHRQHPAYKYRNMEITQNGVRGIRTSAGPTM